VGESASFAQSSVAWRGLPDLELHVDRGLGVAVCRNVHDAGKREKRAEWNRERDEFPSDVVCLDGSGHRQLRVVGLGTGMFVVFGNIDIGRVDHSWLASTPRYAAAGPISARLMPYIFGLYIQSR